MNPIKFGHVEIERDDDGGWVFVKDFLSDFSIRVPDSAFRAFWYRINSGIKKQSKLETWVDFVGQRILIGESSLKLARKDSGEIYYTIEISLEVREFLEMGEEIRKLVYQTP